jgi:hypothetical protein
LSTKDIVLLHDLQFSILISLPSFFRSPLTRHLQLSTLLHPVMLTNLSRLLLVEHRPKRFDKLIDDVLCLVVKEVYLDEGCAGLIRFCLVSRRVYLHCVPKLYRDLNVDFSRASHLHLMKRLSCPGSRVLGLVRALGIVNIDLRHEASFGELSALVAKLSDIARLTWNHGALDVPHFILKALNDRFPQAELAVIAGKVDLGAPTKDIEWPVQPALTHPAGSQLTHFDFEPLTVDQSYDDFKADLVSMLTRNKVLRTCKFFQTSKWAKLSRNARSVPSLRVARAPGAVSPRTNDTAVHTTRVVDLGNERGLEKSDESWIIPCRALDRFGWDNATAGGTLDGAKRTSRQ